MQIALLYILLQMPGRNCTPEDILLLTGQALNPACPAVSVHRMKNGPTFCIASTKFSPWRFRWFYSLIDLYNRAEHTDKARLSSYNLTVGNTVPQKPCFEKKKHICHETVCLGLTQ